MSSQTLLEAQAKDEFLSFSISTSARNTMPSFSRDFEPTVERTSGSRGFFHVDRTSHVQQVLETQCNHFCDYEPTVERMSGPRGFLSCWSSARNTTHSFQEITMAKRIVFMLIEHSFLTITSKTLLEGQCQDEFLPCWSRLRANHWENVRAKRIFFMLIEYHMFNKC